MTQRQVLVLAGVIGTMSPVVAFGLVLLGRAEPVIAGDFAGIGILVGIILSVLTPYLPLRDRGATPRDRMIDLLVIWTWSSVLAQLGWEMPFVWLSPWLKGITEHDHWAFLFWAYGVADHRYLIADPFTVCMEAVTSMVGGPLQLFTLYLFKRGRLRAAAFWGLVVAATQFYGTVLFFGIEAFMNFQHVGNGFVNVWIKFVGLNAIWLVLPPICIYAYATELYRSGERA